MSLVTRITQAVVGASSILVMNNTTNTTSSTSGATATDLPDRPTSSSMHVGAMQLQSAGVMYFAQDGTLFLADPRAAAVYAVDVGESRRDTSQTGVRIDDVDGKIAAALGTTRDQIHIVDMVAHPLSQTLYFSLTRGKGDDAVPLLVSVTKADEKVTLLPLENIRFAKADIPHAPALDAKTPWGAPQRSFTVTHLALVDGQLYIAGLGNEEFASTLRRLPYPFGKEASSTTVEMFHTSHNRYETAAPIESFLPITLAGKPSLVAGYGCSPIVTVTRAELVNGAHVRAKTVAELGGGNRPFDMIRYTNPKGKEYILIANSDRTLARFDPEALASAKAMTTGVSEAYEPGGVPYLPIAVVGVLQLDNYNKSNVVLLQRDIETGLLDVVSVKLNWL